MTRLTKRHVVHWHPFGQPSLYDNYIKLWNHWLNSQ